MEGQKLFVGGAAAPLQLRPCVINQSYLDSLPQHDPQIEKCIFASLQVISSLSLIPMEFYRIHVWSKSSGLYKGAFYSIPFVNDHVNSSWDSEYQDLLKVASLYRRAEGRDAPWRAHRARGGKLRISSASWLQKGSLCWLFLKFISQTLWTFRVN